MQTQHYFKIACGMESTPDRIAIADLCFKNASPGHTVLNSNATCFIALWLEYKRGSFKKKCQVWVCKLLQTGSSWNPLVLYCNCTIFIYTVKHCTNCWYYINPLEKKNYKVEITLKHMHYHHPLFKTGQRNKRQKGHTFLFWNDLWPQQ